MKSSYIITTLAFSSLSVHESWGMSINTLVQKTKDNVYGHGVIILNEIKNNTYQCNPNNMDDIHRSERGIQDLIAQHKTDDLIALLKYFKEREILAKVNGMFIDSANAHIIDAYQKNGAVDKVKSWIDFCELKKIPFDSVNATKAKNFITGILNSELKTAFTQQQQNMQRMQELIKGIQTAQKLQATGTFPEYKDYQNMDTIYALMKKMFEEQKPQVPQQVPQQVSQQVPQQVSQQVPQQEEKKN